MNEITFKGKQHRVYTKKEALTLGIDFNNDWRQAKPGEWILTDTGFVLRCVERGTAGKTGFVRTAAGTFPITDGSVCSHIEREDKWSFSGRRSQISLSRRTKLFTRMYLASGGNATTAFRIAFPRARSKGYIAERIEKILADTEVQKFMMDEIEAAVTKHQVGPEFQLGKAKDLLDVAKQCKDPKDVVESSLKVLRLLKEIAIELRLKKVEISGNAGGMGDHPELPIELTAEQQRALDRGKEMVGGTGDKGMHIKVSGNIIGSSGAGIPVDDITGDPGSSSN